eukprot:5148291-Amphidinium_carterae.1
MVLESCEDGDEAETGHIAPRSLNSNPDNVLAEELAMEICMQDLAVTRTWTEQEMVCSFAGGEVPGTPDGMFETDNGDLHCVQVVRVPVLTTMTGRQMSDRLYDTVLVKIVKSQAWMQSTKIVPCSFAIFCWLLPSLPARNL